jgi:threonyl-tRNA synthetase
MQSKIRDAQIQKVPYVLVVGDREETEGTVAVRNRAGENLGTMKVEDFIAKMSIEIKEKV